MKNTCLGLVLMALMSGCGVEENAQVQIEKKLEADEQPIFGDTCDYFNPLTVVEDVDLEKYLGTWYELGTTTIVRNTFERNCTCTQANYKLLSDGSGVAVRNTCRVGDGTRDTIDGTAKFTDREAVLGVGFPYGDENSGNYYIMKILSNDEGEYQMALVGEPCRLFMWVLSRSRTLDTPEEKAMYDEMLDFAAKQGYRLNSWWVNYQETAQDGCGE